MTPFKATVCAVSDAFGIDPASLLERTRLRPIAYARFAIMRLMHDSGYSYSAIGRRLGMNHASVMHGAAKAEKLAQESREYHQALTAARTLLWHRKTQP